MEEHVEHLWFTGALLCAGLQGHVAEEMTSINTMVPIILWFLNRQSSGITYISTIE